MRRTAPVVALIGLAALMARAAAGDSPAQRRADLLERATRGTSAIPALAAALEDENMVVRRTAARLLGKLGEPSRQALGEALGNSDFVVRLIALRKLTEMPGSDVVPHLETALSDQSPVIRQIAVAELVSIEPRGEHIGKLIEAASRDEAPAVREIAARALWPFHRVVTSIRDRKDWDHDVQVAQAISLPTEGWRFALDVGRDGHLKGWHEVGFDDSEWVEVGIDKAWEEQGHEYDGVAWYRRKFALAEEPEHLAVELHFGAVDECAWVWVNGRYVGQHDIGPEGWDDAFTLDVTEEIAWDAENQITVRVLDSKFAGGIWKPVTVEVLK
ncbi:MAG: HEAT repeat domain-containing protein [Armatimonadota bacterium]